MFVVGVLTFTPARAERQLHYLKGVESFTSTVKTAERFDCDEQAEVAIRGVVSGFSDVPGCWWRVVITDLDNGFQREFAVEGGGH